MKKRSISEPTYLTLLPRSVALKNLNLFFRILIILLVTGVLTCIAGRNYFLSGTILILFRWVFFVVALILLYFTFRRATSIQFKAGLIGILFIIPAEYAWNRAQQRSLTKGSFSNEISLMTYNIFFKNWSPNSSIKAIENFDPDILVLQELTPEMKSKIENSVGTNYRYKKTLALDGTHGIGVYSKYPILHSEFLKNTAGKPFAQVLELEIKTRKIRLINVHLASPAMAVENPGNFIDLFSSNYQERSQQLATINSIADENENQFSAQLLVGDLNTTSYEPLYRDIELQWVNLYDMAGSGLGFNFPHTNKMDPILTLDYIFGRGVIGTIEMKVIEGGGSDHLALAGKIKI